MFIMEMASRESPREVSLFVEVPPGAPGPGLSGPRETRGPRGAGAPRPNAGKCRGAGCHHLAPPSALAERASNPTRPCACCQQCNLTPWRRMSPATEQPSKPAKKGQQPHTEKFRPIFVLGTILGYQKGDPFPTRNQGDKKRDLFIQGPLCCPPGFPGESAPHLWSSKK